MTHVIIMILRMIKFSLIFFFREGDNESQSFIEQITAQTPTHTHKKKHSENKKQFLEKNISSL